MSRIGVPELFVIMTLVLGGLIPWVLGIWALVTLQRIKQGQQSIEQKLDGLAARLPRS
jgi:hypothetical protein